MSKAEQTRQSIIEKAAVIFNEKGIAGTSIDDVLKAADVAKGCLYGHFESKEDLAYASVDYMLAKIRARREAVFSKHKGAVEKIYAYLEVQRNPLNTLLQGGCPVVNLSVESDDTNPVIRKKLKALYESGFKAFTQILQDGIDAGELSDRLNAEEFATKMYASVQGGILISRTMNTAKPMHLVIQSLKAELEGYRVVKV
ncbi:TetR/AcrR family transcriptional regulator [Chitinophaga niabensis]|uniref:DNA-binding transcriptional regulator, AcrR family n=1 Tax=Chitinophaga niabensis TaxID=536979 RepID=A0A1N6JBR0_9BACT|nr:TetR/AcrR family transcriptional regulator [Chitinophaga niabensis]SIO41804.1 DNA-binding transcriptional regulator, AcrR family [Chitinophaga niabensis]